jgi:hypothetical protein
MAGINEGWRTFFIFVRNAADTEGRIFFFCIGSRFAYG